MKYDFEQYYNHDQREPKVYVRESEDVSYSRVRKSIAGRYPIPKTFTYQPDSLTAELAIVGVFGTVTTMAINGTLNAYTTAGSLLLGVLSVLGTFATLVSILIFCRGARDIPKNVKAYFATPLPVGRIIYTYDSRYGMLISRLNLNAAEKYLFQKLIDRGASDDKVRSRVICDTIDNCFNATDELAATLVDSRVSKVIQEQLNSTLDEFAKFYADIITELIREYHAPEARRQERERQEASKEAERAKAKAKSAQQSAQTQADSFAKRTLENANKKLQDVRAMNS